MGTYTANYQLYMPSVGETGWGTLINGNYQTIDTTMKGLSNRITAVENEVNGALNCASVTASGKITGNGGIAGTTGTFSGAVSCTKLTETNKTITVTPTDSYNNSGQGFNNVVSGNYCYLLSHVPNKTYSGTLRFKSGSMGGSITYFTNITSNYTIVNLSANELYDLKLTNAKLFCFKVSGTFVCDFTLS